MSKSTNLGQVVSLGADGALPSFKVSAFNKTTGNVTIKYGVLNVNSKFVASNSEIGVNTTLAGVSLGDYIYMRINGIFSRTSTATVEFFNSATTPQDIEVTAAPFPNVICLAKIHAETGKIFDLRPAWIINVFTFLG